MSERQPHIVVVGGGITGMSAAYALQQHDVRVTLIERSARLGGKIQTDIVDDGGTFVVEGGPDSFVAQKPWAVELARKLGIAEQLQGSEPMRPSTMVLRKGRLHALPEGVMLVVPTRVGPFVRSGLISPLGKLRMALDAMIPARPGNDDESLANFVRRRLGQEALDTLAEPLMAGIHSADAEHQSLLATFPRFREVERAHGSLIRGMRAARRNAAPLASNRPAWATSPFVTLQGGVGTLAAALGAALTCELRLNSSVRALRKNRLDHTYTLQLDDGSQLLADAVVMTTPAYAAAELLAEAAPTLAAALQRIPYVSTATVNLAFDARDLTRPLPGYGVIIPHSEGRRINACTISSRKFAGRAPGGTVLVRAFVGGARTPAALALDDGALEALVRQELRAILGIDAAPRWCRIYRWERSNPQYQVGHLDLVAALMAACPPGLLLAGAAYRGVGIPDCIKQGSDAAEAALAFTRSTRPFVHEPAGVAE